MTHRKAPPKLTAQEKQDLITLRRHLIATLGSIEDRLGMGRSIPKREKRRGKGPYYGVSDFMNPTGQPATQEQIEEHISILDVTEEQK